MSMNLRLAHASPSRSACAGFGAAFGWLLLVLLARAAGAADFVDLRRVAPISGAAAAAADRITACSACHGVKGNAIVAQFPVLAGQSADYLYHALQGFQRRADPASPMTAQVKPLSDSDLRNIAAYFAAAPRHASVPAAADAAQIERGAMLFQQGDASRGMPPCQGCHGAEARGNALAAQDAFHRTFPVLRGQHAAYLIARLAAYRDGHLADTSNARIMRGVAQNLDDASIAALAAWLSVQPD